MSSVLRLRFGEMERDCMIAHGAANFLNERLFEVSDPFSVPLCSNPTCGTISASLQQCHACGCDNVVMTMIPYATKLLVQELNGMCIKVVIHSKE